MIIFQPFQQFYFSQITNLVGQARSTLCMPGKRTLLELCNSAITRCFNPPLPPDLVFSYYISANRLVCAAYQVTPKTNGSLFEVFLYTEKLSFCVIELM